jgi:DinB superfamily
MNQELSQLIDELHAVSTDARSSFGQLTAEQLNWKPSADQWSVAQCLDHLIVSNDGYLPIIEKVKRGEYKRSFKERLPVLPRIFGSLVVNVVKPEGQRKLKAGKAFVPSSSEISSEIVSRFEAQQKEIAEQMRSTDGLNLHKIIVTSPVASFVTYSLLDGYRIIVAHDQRHVAQAKRVMAREGFPKVG